MQLDNILKIVTRRKLSGDLEHIKAWKLYRLIQIRLFATFYDAR